MEPFRLPLFCAGLKDLITPPQYCEDDSMYNFAQRRFGTELAKYAIGR